MRSDVAMNVRVIGLHVRQVFSWKSFRIRELDADMRASVCFGPVTASVYLNARPGMLSLCLAQVRCGDSSRMVFVSGFVHFAARGGACVIVKTDKELHEKLMQVPRCTGGDSAPETC